MNAFDKLAGTLRDKARAWGGVNVRMPSVTTAQCTLRAEMVAAISGGGQQAAFSAPPVAWAYEADALPQSSLPVWAADVAGAPFAAQAFGLLTMACGPSDRVLYSYADSALDNAAGTTLETRLKVSGAGASALLSLEDGAQKFAVGIRGSGLLVNGAWLAFDCTEYVTLKLVGRGTGGKLYVNGDLLKTWLTPDASAAQQVTFGVDTATVAETLFVDYLRGSQSA